MEVGYDYTLFGGRPHRKARHLPALLVAALAGVLLISGLAYYGFRAGAEAGQVSVVATVGADATLLESSAGNPVAAVSHNHRVAPASADDIAGQQLYPAGLSDSRYWVNPLSFDQ